MLLITRYHKLIMQVIQPDYYSQCSILGTNLLIKAGYPHSQNFNLECIEVIENSNFDYCMGSAFKYLWRLGEKGNFFNRQKLLKDDIAKAHYYVMRFVKNNSDTDIPDWIIKLAIVLKDYDYAQEFN